MTHSFQKLSSLIRQRFNWTSPWKKQISLSQRRRVLFWFWIIGILQLEQWRNQIERATSGVSCPLLSSSMAESGLWDLAISEWGMLKIRSEYLNILLIHLTRWFNPGRVWHIMHSLGLWVIESESHRGDTWTARYGLVRCGTCFVVIRRYLLLSVDMSPIHGCKTNNDVCVTRSPWSFSSCWSFRSILLARRGL